MAYLFNTTEYDLADLLSRIDQGEIRLPDIQRPFVWGTAKVRELFDSMYQGYPVGILLMWENNTESNSRTIGEDNKRESARYMLIDGQQRMTSLYSVIKGVPIRQKGSSERQRIKIAFSPIEERFEVTDASIERDPLYISDVSKLYTDDSFEIIDNYVSNYKEKIEENDDDSIDIPSANDIRKRIDRVCKLDSYKFNAIVLNSAASDEQVADIFVRINSQGTQLNQSDFILTLMSVWWEEGRVTLEEFCEKAEKHNPKEPNAYNHIIDLEPSTLLRVAVGIAFKRGRLKYAYSLLQGKDLETGKFDPDRRDNQFKLLEEAQNQVLNLTNWHEFLKCIRSAGFPTKRLITSNFAITFSYMLWLMGKLDFKVDKATLQRQVSRWFFMSQTTARYSGSSESQFESDLRRIETYLGKGPDGFNQFIDNEIKSVFTSDYWKVSLPNKLDTTGAKSPALTAYFASLIVLQASALFSNQSINSLIDPAIRETKNVEVHHLFPQAYLQKELGLSRNKTNFNANKTFVDWPENIAISDAAPSKYFPQLWEGLSASVKKDQAFWHALPDNWENMEYEEFLEARRSKMAEVVRAAFEKLSDASNGAEIEDGSIEAQITKGESLHLEYKSSARWNVKANMQDKKMEHVIAKTISAFMNTEGGALIIGVEDDGNVIGLENDYKVSGNKGRDGFELFLNDLVADRLDGVTASNIKVDFTEIEGKDICRVVANASRRKVYCKSIGSNVAAEFWVRAGNSTRQLHGQEMDMYVEDHWG